MFGEVMGLLVFFWLPVDDELYFGQSRMAQLIQGDSFCCVLLLLWLQKELPIPVPTLVKGIVTKVCECIGVF
jgi:hypothetical protein